MTQQIPVMNHLTRMFSFLPFVWKIAPPLIFVLPLCFMPWDSTTLFWWGGCGIAAVFSLVSLIAALRRSGKLSRHAVTKPLQRDVLLGALRPALTIGLFLLAVVSLNVIENRSARQSEAALAEILNECKLAQCPDVPQGWMHSDAMAWKQVGYWKLTYQIRRASAGGGVQGGHEDKEFLLTVAKRTEDEECYRGNSSGLASHTHSVQCSSEY